MTGQAGAGGPLIQMIERTPPDSQLSFRLFRVDHTGLPNARLVEEGGSFAIMYDMKSVAEKNSFTVGFLPR
jgi:hypothetical protein